MILTDYFLSKPDRQWLLAKQLGVNHATVRLPEDPSFDLTDYRQWKALSDTFLQYGIKPTVIEPVPNAIHDHIKAGDSQRDAAIEQFLKMLPIMDALDIRTICVNFMALVGWYRTTNARADRGGALVTGFELADCDIDPTLSISEEKLWDNLRIFLEAAVPEAERCGIRLALHPDDPPLPRLGNVSRILTTRDALLKAIRLVPSPNLGLALCQGCYCAMGEDIYDVIRSFLELDKVFFVHFRDVNGCLNSFHETFHDNGPTDMARALRLYQQYGYHGPIRVDHVPTMAGEGTTDAGYQIDGRFSMSNAGACKPGYELEGRLFAIGYLKGLLDALGYDYI